MAWSLRAVNLDRRFEVVQVTGESWVYVAEVSAWHYYPELLWVEDSRRWFGDECHNKYHFEYREITAEMAAEWWQANCPDRLVPPELRDDLRRELAAAVPSPPEGEAADPAADRPDGSGDPDRPAPEGRQARKVARGELDERAVALLLKNPTLTLAQLAVALGCQAGTLRDRRKCPKLAAARASIKAQREAFRGGSTWRDRRPGDDEA